MSFNKRGVLGEIIITFIATIVIIVILVLFALGSAVLRKSDDTFAGISTPKSNAETGVADYIDHFYDLTVLRSIMTSRDGGEFKTFFGAMQRWDNYNSDKVSDAVSKFKPAEGILLADKTGVVGFYCGANGCVSCTASICGTINTNQFLQFRLSPLNVELKLR